MMPIRNAVRVLLLNGDKLLLMRIEGFDISAIDNKPHHRFWCTIGGGIESGESIQEAAMREIYEETSLSPENIELGPIVWRSDLDLMLRGTLTRFKEIYVAAKTSTHNVSLHQPTPAEQAIVKELKWFTLEEIKQCPDVIFPTSLSQHLPDILAGIYPEEPILIQYAEP